MVLGVGKGMGITFTWSARRTANRSSCSYAVFEWRQTCGRRRPIYG